MFGVQPSSQYLNRAIRLPAPADIDKSLIQIQTVIDYFDLATQEENTIVKGPDEGDLTPYLTSVQKMKDALEYLVTTKYKASARGITHLLDDLFRKWLTAASVPADLAKNGGGASGTQLRILDHVLFFIPRTSPTSHLLDSEIPEIPEKQLKNLQRLSTELSAPVADLGPVTVCVETYREVRSAYLTKSLAGLAAAAREQDQKGGAGKAAACVGSG
ncbi:hypothetical protein BDK51DRAFT_45426 [Blyttiomyces helicus]|uniref:Uncharacterized protein n=1 Tax=Blyttiomyces helicus TaxID=388810 RepID=A0A4P9VX29_9FUNG|nr:hypothetical protein BDK51DRAFT_45426 [Blyttiomyces helicus]|eukprot:RKO83253.1 hypothetical protein BDK51DRAFT_45426 [Blyttiomyces helicus]